jgi:NAD(P)H-nitrite reductase large subunit
MTVTVVHLLDSLMERQLDPAAAALLKASLEPRGLRFLMPAQTAAILGDTRVRGVLGEARATRRYLHALFPSGYGPQVCDVAGMTMPRKVMLDV